MEKIVVICEETFDVWLRTTGYRIEERDGQFYLVNRRGKVKLVSDVDTPFFHKQCYGYITHKQARHRPLVRML